MMVGTLAPSPTPPHPTPTTHPLPAPPHHVPHPPRDVTQTVLRGGEPARRRRFAAIAPSQLPAGGRSEPRRRACPQEIAAHQPRYVGPPGYFPNPCVWNKKTKREQTKTNSHGKQKHKEKKERKNERKILSRFDGNLGDRQQGECCGQQAKLRVRATGQVSLFHPLLTTI